MAVGGPSHDAFPDDVLGLLQARAAGNGWLHQGQGSIGWCDLHEADVVPSTAGVHGVWLYADLARPLAPAEQLPLQVAAGALGALLERHASGSATMANAVVTTPAGAKERPGGHGPVLASVLSSR